MADVTLPPLNKEKMNALEQLAEVDIQDFLDAGYTQEDYQQYKALKQESLKKLQQATTVEEIGNIVEEMRGFRKKNFPTIKEVADSSPYVPPALWPESPPKKSVGETIVDALANLKMPDIKLPKKGGNDWGKAFKTVRPAYFKEN